MRRLVSTSLALAAIAVSCKPAGVPPLHDSNLPTHSGGLVLPAFQATTGQPLLRPASLNTGVLGHDGSRSMPQPDGSSLWLFSDTFFGTWGSNGGRQISGAVHSCSAVVQPSDLATGFAGAVYDGKPPTEVLVHPPGEDTNSIAGWLMDSFFIGDTMWSYYMVVTQSGPDPLDLVTIGIGVLPAQGLPPKFVRPTPETFLFSSTDPTFGSAATVFNGFVYTYGEPATPNLNPDVFVARALVASVADRSAYEFFAGLDSSQNPIWQSDESMAISIYSGGVNSVTFDSHINSFLALYTPPFAGTIEARMAPNPWGPWSDSELIVDCYPSDSQVYCYDAHRHADLESGDGQTMILSYDTNTSTLAELSEPNYSEVYWPRLVEVTFAR